MSKTVQTSLPARVGEKPILPMRPSPSVPALLPTGGPLAMPAPASDQPDTAGQALDRLLHAWQGRMTASVSPAAMTLSFMDWAIHFANTPGRQIDLAQAGIALAARLGDYAMAKWLDPAVDPCILPTRGDRRFNDPIWREPPFDLFYQSFLSVEEWWRLALSDVPGVETRHENVLNFTVRQMLDMMAPSNFPWTNPEVLRTTWEKNGNNLIDGLRNFGNDVKSALDRSAHDDNPFKPGEGLALTPGEVVLRNDLIELIRYRPTTETVHPEPILIVPAWIMKYYILDLRAENSLVRYLVDQGHQVYMISWRNPGVGERDLGMEEYRTLGIMAALDAIGRDHPGQQIHACGYCLGGTLLSIAAASMARDDDRRLASMTLLAAQVDFTEAGELTLFINESQLAWLDDVMWDQGYLEARQMAGAFQMLNSNDLVWSHAINEYMKGEKHPMNDLMAWNADATRMPYRMHSQYLRTLFLHNDLAEGRYKTDEREVALGDLSVPTFLVGTETDHVAPWRSVYKFTLLTDTDVSFVLTSGGHNAGIVSEPGHPHRRYRLLHRPIASRHLSQDQFLAETKPVDGSWWPAWQAWLAAHSAQRIAPPVPVLPGLCPAPGLYVLEP